jgi:DNA-3-methyladenine glycosylase II
MVIDSRAEHEAARVYLLGIDDPLSRLVAGHGAIEFYRPTAAVELPDLLSGLTLHIIGQQISRFAAIAIFTRLTQLLGGTIDPARLATTSEDELRGVGLSYAKARALRELAERVRSGTLDFDSLHGLGDEETLARLIQLRGVGPWSAQVFMLRDLHRPDVFPAGDIALRKAIAALDQLPATPSTQEAEQRALAWRPYRSYAAGYLWRSYAETSPGPASAPITQTAPPA